MKKKGRAKRGFIIGIRKGWGEGESRLMWEEEKGIVVSKIKGRKEKDFIVISIYNTGK